MKKRKKTKKIWKIKNSKGAKEITVNKKKRKKKKDKLIVSKRGKIFQIGKSSEKTRQERKKKKDRKPKGDSGTKRVEEGGKRVEGTRINWKSQWKSVRQTKDFVPKRLLTYQNKVADLKRFQRVTEKDGNLIWRLRKVMAEKVGGKTFFWMFFSLFFSFSIFFIFYFSFYQKGETNWKLKWTNWKERENKNKIK